MPVTATPTATCAAPAAPPMASQPFRTLAATVRICSGRRSSRPPTATRARPTASRNFSMLEPAPPKPVTVAALVDLPAWMMAPPADWNLPCTPATCAPSSCIFLPLRSVREARPEVALPAASKMRATFMPRSAALDPVPSISRLSPAIPMRASRVLSALNPMENLRNGAATLAARVASLPPANTAPMPRRMDPAKAVPMSPPRAPVKASLSIPPSSGAASPMPWMNPRANCPAMNSPAPAAAAAAVPSALNTSSWKMVEDSLRPTS